MNDAARACRISAGSVGYFCKRNHDAVHEHLKLSGRSWGPRRLFDFANIANRLGTAVVGVLLGGIIVSVLAGSNTPVLAQSGLAVQNGWYVQDGHVIWGYCQHNGWWRPGQRPNIARNAPGQIGPNRTEDLDKLTDAMLRFAYPGFEHNFGLWYDRRRDRHDTARRTDAHVVPPFLEQPWARSGQGTAWDGLSKYDLTKYNAWYFQRVKEFADLCDRKGTILFFNFYMQHTLLETQAHYADFPWRPANCIQPTGLPDQVPAANVFYDVSNPVRRKLHQAYIHKCLDVLGHNTNVVFLCSEEYTGPRDFMQFWLDTIFAWERDHHHKVHIGLSATKDVEDAILADRKYAPRIATLDLRYWWYLPDGKLFAPPGGQQVAGRYTYGVEKTTPEQFHRQILEYRHKFPDKALLHGAPGTRQHAWAGLTAGVSMLVGQLPYPHMEDPAHYISPERCRAIQPTYDFIRRHLSTILPAMTPRALVASTRKTIWCLADPEKSYLIYALHGGQFVVDLRAAAGTPRAQWFDPRTGKLEPAVGKKLTDRKMEFAAPDNQDWALWIDVRGKHVKTTHSKDQPAGNRGTNASPLPHGKTLSHWEKWRSIELTFRGPTRTACGNPNPFAVRFEVVFRAPTGREYRVPGFYDGDGHGGPDGNVWKVRFSADRVGIWAYRTSSDIPSLNDKRGRFAVTEPSAKRRGFWHLGRLESVGTAANEIRYLKFRDGPYWLKAGCDDPENFLGNYHHFNTLAKRCAAVDYLAQLGINSLYMMTHNIGGDDNDVWPWLGSTVAEAKQNALPGKVRFDIPKLTEWRALFEHMQQRGVVPYLVLEDDSAWTGYDHARYYREIIARFGDLPALLFNIGEENNENYPLQQGLAFAALLRRLDPYRHPIGIHNVNRPNSLYIDSPDVDFTSIQTGQPGSRKGLRDAIEHNRIALDWIAQCRARGRRVLVVGFDEGRPELDRRAWWSAYLGGGVWEAHVTAPYDRSLSTWDTTWRQLGGTRTFIESMPFWEMRPHNELVKNGQAFCLAKPHQVYALYLPAGGSIQLQLPSGERYRCSWWDPANGRAGKFQEGQNIKGGLQTLQTPTESDWAVRITRR